MRKGVLWRLGGCSKGVLPKQSGWMDGWMYLLVTLDSCTHTHTPASLPACLDGLTFESSRAIFGTRRICDAGGQSTRVVETGPTRYTVERCLVFRPSIPVTAMHDDGGVMAGSRIPCGGNSGQLGNLCGDATRARYARAVGTACPLPTHPVREW